MTKWTWFTVINPSVYYNHFWEFKNYIVVNTTQKENTNLLFADDLQSYSVNHWLAPFRSVLTVGGGMSLMYFVFSKSILQICGRIFQAEGIPYI